ncbi:MAG: hypothetical protein BWY31_02062 [Lentisphaerae bacterium ADurb.Bin242]|nr:MAG: hypothetical protein BWY31_02062 [Lentisphaerae bacterium ADurb.Bin242]
MKSLTLTAAILTAAVSLSAADLKINEEFKGSKLGNAVPAGWMKNFEKDPNIGVTTVVKGKKEGEFAVQIKTEKKETPFYSGPFDASAGDTVKISAKVKGKGKIQLGYYAYGPGFLTAKFGTPFDVKEQEGEYESRIGIQEAPKGKISSIRIVFQALANSDLTVSEVEAELISAK